MSLKTWPPLWLVLQIVFNEQSKRNGAALPLPLTRLLRVLFILLAGIEGQGDHPAFSAWHKLQNDIETAVLNRPECADACPAGVFTFRCKPNGVRRAFVGIGFRHNSFLFVNQTATITAFHGNRS